MYVMVTGDVEALSYLNDGCFPFEVKDVWIEYTQKWVKRFVVDIKTPEEMVAFQEWYGVSIKRSDMLRELENGTPINYVCEI